MPTSESSAVITRRPLHRRYFSYNETDPSSSRPEAISNPNVHTRNESDLHPLGRASHLHDGTVTRPHLARALGDGFKNEVGNRCPQDKGKSKDVSSIEEPEIGPHKMVIEHEITPTDSLAGVALKYGISVAELRRANQLWHSDSIHLRKLLYIPVEQTMKHSFKPLIDLLENTDNDTTPHLESKNSTIKRIPASKLSFFPSPSSTTPISSPSKPAPVPKTSPRHYRHATTDANSAFSSSPLSGLLTSLPIVTRLSFDSTTSSEDAEQDVELEVVRRRDTPPDNSRNVNHRSHATIPHRCRDDDLPLKKRPPIPEPASFRTVQLAPQPDMLLPLLPKARSMSLRIKRLHSDSELLLS